MPKCYLSSLEELREQIRKQTPSLYLGAQTSTVIPFENLPPSVHKLNFCYLEKMPQKYELTKDGHLHISGPVNWQDARSYLRSKGRDLLTAPTEELASILAGLATSATGERCFGLGTLRNQVIDIDFLNFEGVSCHLSSDKPFLFGDEKLRLSYQKACSPFSQFKNPPFPNFFKETDLMVGTEGQLGVITEARLKTGPFENTLFLMLPLPCWEKDRTWHLEIFEKVQSFRNELISVEFFDHNSVSYLSREDNLSSDFDYMVFELREKSFEKVYEEFILKLSNYDTEKTLEISARRFQEIRAKIPRSINEVNSRLGVKKLGTDVQALGRDFEKLLDQYEDFSKNGIKYCLFGHFGDGHLHFNFMPLPNEVSKVKESLVHFYKKLSLFEVSPFAEHGIGLLKQDFIQDYYSATQKDFFRSLKLEFDPHGQFFPMGFMSI